MLNSMTGFGGEEKDVLPIGKLSVELRSSNHKFLDIVFHLPEGFLSLEGRIKKEIEAHIKRGRVTCAINIVGKGAQRVFINRDLLKNYISAMKSIKNRFDIENGISLDTLVHLPGVLSLTENRIDKERIWPSLKIIINQALGNLVKARQKEGKALYVYLNRRAQSLANSLGIVKTRFSKVVKKKVSGLKTDDERVSFLRNADISEEIERLSFHIRNFRNKLSKGGPVGKELDFIAQEMQREANTIAAKSCDALISGRVVEMKSQVEKIREQVQNIE